MNRYTQLTPSAYNPMSMQEIMMTPLAMREQHNKSEQTLDLYNQELQKIKALPVHTPEAMERKNYLISKIDSLASDLSNKGFSNDMTSNLIKLNREIKDDFSPTGRLGKISGAYDTYFKEMEAFKKDNADKKWSQDEFNRHWNDHINNYQGYDEKGEVINIGSLSAPEKIEISEKFKELKSIMGDANLAYKTLTGYTKWRQGPNGSLISTDVETGKETKYNNPQVVGILSQVVSELNDPTSTLSKSRVYSGRTVEQALQESGNLAKSMVNVELGQTNKAMEDIYGYKNTIDLANEQAANAIITANTEETSNDFEGSIGQATATFNKLNQVVASKGWNGLSDDEKEDYIEAKGMLDNFNKINTKSTKDYKHIIKSNGKSAPVHYANELGFKGNKEITLDAVKNIVDNSKNTFLSTYKKGTKEYEMAKIMAGDDPYKDILASRYAEDNNIKEQYSKMYNNYTKTVMKKEKIYNSYRNDVFSNINTYSQYYKPLTSDSESATGKMFKVIDDALTQTVKSASSGNSLGDITHVTDTEGNIINLRSGDLKKSIIQNRKNINKVMQLSEKLEFIDLTDNDKGYPAIRLRVTPGKDNEEVEKLLGGIWKKGEVGGNKPFDVTIKLDDVTNIKSGSSTGYGTRSILTQLLDVMIQRGDEKGIAVAKSALNRIQANK